jgi:hypothetical protein
MSREDTADFQPEPDSPGEPSFEIEPPGTSPTEAAITWRWATAADLPALRVCHFRAEVEAGDELYLPEQSTDQRIIAVAEQDGRIIGGLFAEDSIVVTMVGLEQSVAKSAYDAVIHPIILTFARNEGTRLVEVRLPRGVKFDLQTGAELGQMKPTQ